MFTLEHNNFYVELLNDVLFQALSHEFFRQIILLLLKLDLKLFFCFKKVYYHLIHEPKVMFFGWQTSFTESGQSMKAWATKWHAIKNTDCIKLSVSYTWALVKIENLFNSSVWQMYNLWNMC